MTQTGSRQMGPLNPRERDVLDVLVTMHGEYGLDKQLTREAITLIAGPCAGSLAGLALKGYARQMNTSDGIAYQVTEAGYALFAGVEGQV